MSPARPWTAWWLPKGTIRTISRVGIISFIGARSWTPSLCRARSRLSCSASTLSPTCGRALGFLRTINREGLHFRWRNSYTQSYILKWLNRWVSNARISQYPAPRHDPTVRHQGLLQHCREAVARLVSIAREELLHSHRDQSPHRQG